MESARLTAGRSNRHHKDGHPSTGKGDGGRLSLKGLVLGILGSGLQVVDTSVFFILLGSVGRDRVRVEERLRTGG